MTPALRWLALPLLWLALHTGAQAHTCSVAATPLAFGAYTSPGGARVDSQAGVTVTCTPTYLLLACSVSYTLTLSSGSNGSPGNRQMAAGSGRLGYGLYSDSNRQSAWGDGGAGGPGVGGNISTNLLGLGVVCLAGAKNHTVYARIPANQVVPAGSYGDTVVLTITY
ncbi:MAG: spore coat protein U domain-containing protein [Hydrogenophaga sp.]|uniref:Spore coat protein U domain-containing protein n=1 Tax=Hydrogenophaga crocea TaxID=2716225 RepID=A0A6G8IE62_9BURK|nr:MULTISPECIES: spore coat U domain-containing protein [Hydrogenophaga]MBL0943396.1 spore coat protein U domain-containing protein [Hydrogenophaga sp.]QIM51477.1 spore coat protein U domain-containing protein [Hydrogenophaga crocea]